MIGAFLDQGPQTVQHLRAAVRDAQPLELRVNAHAVKWRGAQPRPDGPGQHR